MFLTYRYRLLPTKRQHRALEQILESQRELYNAALEERIDAYRKAKVRRTYFDQAKGLTVWRQSDPDASSLPVDIQRGTLKRVDEACKGFFRRCQAGHKAGYPRFRGKGRFNSFSFLEFDATAFRNGRMRFKGMPGILKLHMHRKLPEQADIRSCVFRRDVKGWFVGFAVRVEAPRPRPVARVIGIDLGITCFAALSDGNAIPSLRAALRAERSLRIAHRALSRTAKQSRGRQKARAVLRRCHAATARRRSNHLHQASALLARNYEAIVVEALNVKGLIQGPLAKHIHDASWGKFISMLRYKAEWAGARIVEVPPHGTSQECSRCGSKVPKTLAVRTHNCPDCGLSIDRDLNAALNILHRAGMGPGLHNVAECGMRAGGNLEKAPSVGYSPSTETYPMLKF